ncbi:T9SS type A sorting domain-containing protein [Sediminitomix flava]|uniref:Putative secreted protein (Por secretion system target) n=1 Tax=Sediminitomix flava TaxID=379075 RepID=A0A315ZLE5_SEDFL|nr:T9SS type A sorting domain-containing protein [Sediminitomix flava]PWJ34994.1 putative secreted protein (Por secretion system target) [Sediminitomix flava]
MKNIFTHLFFWGASILATQSVFAQQYTGKGYAGGVAGTNYSAPSTEITAETGAKVLDGSIIFAQNFDVADDAGPDFDKDNGVTFEIKYNEDKPYTDGGGGDIRGYSTKDGDNPADFVAIRFNNGNHTWRRSGKWVRYSVDFAAGDFNFIYRAKTDNGFSDHKFFIRLYDPADMSTAVFEHEIDLTEEGAFPAADGDTFNKVRRIGGGNSQTAWFKLLEKITVEAKTYVVEIDDAITNGQAHYGEFAFNVAEEIEEPTEPEISIVVPLSESYVWDSTEVKVNAFDPAVGDENGDGVDSVMFELKDEAGAVVGKDTIRVSPFAWKFNSLDHADGNYSIVAKAAFTSAVEASTEPVNIKIKNTPPAISWVTPIKTEVEEGEEPDRAEIKGNAYQIEVSVADPAVGVENGDGILNVYFQLFDKRPEATQTTAIETYTDEDGLPYTWVLDTEQYEDGNYELRIGVRLLEGKTAWSSNPVMIKNISTEATVSFDGLEDDDVLYGTYDFSVMAYDPAVGTDNGSGVTSVVYMIYDDAQNEVSRDTLEVAPYTYSVNTLEMADGNYMIDAVASFSAAAPEFVSKSFTVNNAVAVSWTSETPSSDVYGTVDFELSAQLDAVTDGGGVTSVTYVLLNENDEEVATSELTVAPFAWSLNTVEYADGNYSVLADVLFMNGVVESVDTISFVVNNAATVSWVTAFTAAISDTKSFEVSAYLDVLGTTHGEGVTSVTYTLSDASENELSSVTVSDAPFSTELVTTEYANGDYLMVATVTFENGKEVSTESLAFTIFNAPLSAGDDLKLAGVAPNPFQDVLTVLLNKSVATTIELLDINGNVVLFLEVEGVEQQEIATSHLTEGLYILRVVQGDKVSTLKVVK